MSKKKHDVMEREREIFINGLTDDSGKVVVEGCVRRGIDKASAISIFSEMESFASYAFNKSHAAAYALISYRTAYLKAHHPGAYFAALLTSEKGWSGKEFFASIRITVEDIAVSDAEATALTKISYTMFGKQHEKNATFKCTFENERWYISRVSFT